MDLSTIREKLKRHSYADRFAFESDFQLMIRNAQEYNPTTHPVHIASRAFDTFFKTGMHDMTCCRPEADIRTRPEWAKANKALDKATSRSGHILPPPSTGGDDMANAALALEVEPLQEHEKATVEAADELAALIELAPPPSLPPPPTLPGPQPSLKLKLTSGRSTPKEPVARATPPAPPAVESLVQTIANSAKPPKPPKLSKPPKPLKIVVQSQSTRKPTPPRPAPAPPVKATPSSSIREDEDILLAELDMIEAEKGHTPSPMKKSKPKDKDRNVNPMDLSEDWLLSEAAVEQPKEQPKERTKGKEKAERKMKLPSEPTVKSQASLPPKLPVASSSTSNSARPSPTVSLAPPPAPASVKLKVRSKESTPVAQSSSSSTRTATTPIDLVKCKAIINKLRKETAHALPFGWPVDAIAQGCPT